MGDARVVNETDAAMHTRSSSRPLASRDPGGLPPRGCRYVKYHRPRAAGKVSRSSRRSMTFSKHQSLSHFSSGGQSNRHRPHLQVKRCGLIARISIKYKRAISRRAVKYVDEVLDIHARAHTLVIWIYARIYRYAHVHGICTVDTSIISPMRSVIHTYARTHTSGAAARQLMAVYGDDQQQRVGEWAYIVGNHACVRVRYCVPVCVLFWSVHRYAYACVHVVDHAPLCPCADTAPPPLSLTLPEFDLRRARQAPYFALLLTAYPSSAASRSATCCAHNLRSCWVGGGL
jgi:hypothetical protein